MRLKPEASRNFFLSRQCQCMCVCLCVLNLKVCSASGVRFGNGSGHRGYIDGLSMSLGRKVCIWKFHDRACTYKMLPTSQSHLNNLCTCYPTSSPPLYDGFDCSPPKSLSSTSHSFSPPPPTKSRGSQYPKQMMRHQ